MGSIVLFTLNLKFQQSSTQRLLGVSNLHFVCHVYFYLLKYHVTQNTAMTFYIPTQGLSMHAYVHNNSFLTFMGTIA